VYVCTGTVGLHVHGSEWRQRIWSEWIESRRKDVECVFGSMKKRFRFLKHAIEIHSQHEIDNAFFTCCTLHNIILMYDGLDTL
jgi:DDE superfamily endonuclease